MPYERPTPLGESPPHPSSDIDIDELDGAPSLSALDPYAPYSSSSDDASDHQLDLDDANEPVVYGTPSTHIPLALGSRRGQDRPDARSANGGGLGAIPGSDSGLSGGTTATAGGATVGSVGTGNALTSPTAMATGLGGLGQEPGPATAPVQDPLLYPVLPRMTRAFSNPLPAQLRHLQHPLVRSSSTFDAAGALLLSPTTTTSPTAISASSSSSSLFTPGVYPTIQTHTDYFQSLSLEIADSVQPIIQTLLQLSPPHILDPAKEQFSACTVQIPTASVSGLLTAMKGLNYLSAWLAMDGRQRTAQTAKDQLDRDLRREIPQTLGRVEEEEEEEEFDIGEMLQNVGDTLAGLAAQAGVDLVLYHADVGMLHVGVKADESAIAYLLAHVLRQVLATTERGDTLEVGLSLSRTIPRSPLLGGIGLGLPNLETEFASSCPTPTPDTLQCTFDIIHRLHTPASTFSLGSAAFSGAGDERRVPSMAGQISQRLLSSLRATFTSHRSDPYPSPGPPSRYYTLQLALRAGLPLVEPLSLTADEQLSRQPYPSYKLPPEPTLDELYTFIRSDLRGKKVALFASPSSAFARHVTSYLTSWGMDVLHVPTDGTEEVPSGVTGEMQVPTSPTVEKELQEALAGADPEPVSSGSEGEARPRGPVSAGGAGSAGGPNGFGGVGGATGGGGTPAKLSFVIIDDDVVVLRRRLVHIRKEKDELRDFRLNANATNASVRNSRVDKLASPPQRPTLSTHHRPRSGQQNQPRSPGAEGTSASGDAAGSGASSGSGSGSGSYRTPSGSLFENAVIIHFTSLSNFKLVRDAVQTLLALPTPQFNPQAYSPYIHPNLPEVIVIPKPAGPRRLLTALHTGMYKPLVDPFFSPIATSPLSPAGMHPLSPFFTPPGGEDFAASFGMSSPVVTAPSPAAPSSPAPPPGPIQIQSRDPHGTLYLPGGFHKARSPGPSPLAQPPQNVPETEYFPGDAVKIGSSASSGVVIQSPDGRPTGVFFQPLSRVASTAQGTSGSAAPVADSGASPPSGVPDPANAQTAPVKPGMVSKPSGEQRQVPIGMIFSPSQVIDSYRSPGGEGPPHLPFGGSSRKQARRTTTGETRPFLLPGRDEELPENLRRMSARRAASSGTNASIAAGMPLPPSRPGSARVPSGGSSRETAALNGPNVVGRRASGPIVSGSSMALAPVDLPGAMIEASAGPVLPTSPEKRPVDPDKQAQRDNIRKLIQAGVEAATPSAVRMDGTSVADFTTPSATSVPGAVAAAPTATIPLLPALPGSHAAHPAGPLTPPIDQAVPAAKPRVSTFRRASDVALQASKKKSVGDNVVVPPINVLIVEDNPINQTILMTFMRRKKIKYGTANDGAQAVEKWKTGGYHLILMDIQMPVMDGIEATKEIRRLESQANLGLYPTTPPTDALRIGSPAPLKGPTTPGGGMPQSSPHRSSVIIVALTASSLPSDRVAALGAGCNDFLTKPVSLKWLEKKIIEWGSIKALQMWADSAVTRGFSNGQAARGAKVRDQLRIDRPGRTTPSPGSASRDQSSTDTDTTLAHPVPRPASGSESLLGKVLKETVSGNSVAASMVNGQGTDNAAARRAKKVATFDESYFTGASASDVFAPSDAKSLLLQDVLDDEDEDSPAETVKESSPRQILADAPEAN